MRQSVMPPATDVLPASYGPLLEEVRALLPARVQKLSVGAQGELVVELYAGEKRPLTVDLGPGGLRLVLARPDDVVTPDKPPAVQGLLRKELVPSRLEAVDLDAERGALQLRFLRPDEKQRAIVLELSERDPRALLLALGDVERVLSVLHGGLSAKDGRDLRRGRPYEAPRAPGALLPLTTTAPSDDGARGALEEQRGELKDLRARLKAEARRLERLARGLEGDLAKHGDPDALALDGELLKTALGQVNRGTREISVVDFEGRPRVIALDPALDARGNLDRLFKRARRAREGVARVRPRLDEVKARAARVAELREALAREPVDEGALEEARELVGARAFGPSARRRAVLEGGRKPWRAFSATGGVIVKVGRSAKDNDDLTFHYARGNDLWLHTRDAPGSHVILPLEGGKDPPPELLLDAAHLAVWFSPVRESERADVQYARRKHVKKPGKGAAPGFVHIHGEKVLHLKVDRARIERLLASEVAA